MTSDEPRTGSDEDMIAFEPAAVAVRRLTQALCSHRASDEVLEALASTLDGLAAAIERDEPRDKLAELRARPALAPLFTLGEDPVDVLDGEQVEFDPFTFVGGRYHPGSIGCTYERDGDEVVGRVTISPTWAGPPGRVHGGAIAAVIDEVMGAVNRINGMRAVTASLTVNYKAAAPLDEPLEFRARLAEKDGRKITLTCAGASEEGVFVEAAGLFIETKGP